MITIKELAGYLPYGVKFINKDGEINTLDGLFVDLALHFSNANRTDYFHFLSEFKPILRPLSDLTKEIEHNG